MQEIKLACTQNRERKNAVKNGIITKQEWSITRQKMGDSIPEPPIRNIINLISSSPSPIQTEERIRVKIQKTQSTQRKISNSIFRKIQREIILKN